METAVYPQPDASRGGAYRWHYRIDDERSETNYASKAEAQEAADAAVAARQAPAED